MKLKKALIHLTLLTMISFSKGWTLDFKVLGCRYKKTENGTSVTLRMDNLFVEDVYTRLREGAEYLLKIELKLGNGKKENKELSFSYDPINRIYVVRGCLKKRFKKSVHFRKSIKEFSFKASSIPVKARAVRIDPYLPYPFNAIPFFGSFKTRWVNCYAER